MWNAFLDLPVELEIRQKECIEKGSLEKSRDDYYALMKASLKEMYRVLKFNRWLCFVFQHQDLKLWQTLVDEAKKIGFLHIKTVRQSNGQSTIKYRQFTATMVSGQLLVYFKKVKDKVSGSGVISGDNKNTLIEAAKMEIIQNNGATLAQIHDTLVIKAMNEGFFDELLDMGENLKFFLAQHFNYDEKSKKYTFAEASEIKMGLDKKARTLIISYFNRCKKENKPAIFSDICLEIIPKLTNGVTPDDRYIKEILEEIAQITNSKTGEWRLKSKEATLFDDLP